MRVKEYKSYLPAIAAFAILVCYGWNPALAEVIDTILQPESDALAELFSEDLATAVGIGAVIFAIGFAIARQWFAAIVTVIIAAICYIGIELFGG